MDLKLEELQANMFAPELYERLRQQAKQHRAQVWQIKMASQESPEPLAPQLHGRGCMLRAVIVVIVRCSKDEPDPERTASYAEASDVPTPPPSSPMSEDEALFLSFGVCACCEKCACMRRV